MSDKPPSRAETVARLRAATRAFDQSKAAYWTAQRTHVAPRYTYGRRPDHVKIDAFKAMKGAERAVQQAKEALRRHDCPEHADHAEAAGQSAAPEPRLMRGTSAASPGPGQRERSVWQLPAAGLDTEAEPESGSEPPSPPTPASEGPGTCFPVLHELLDVRASDSSDADAMGAEAAEGPDGKAPLPDLLRKRRTVSFHRQGPEAKRTRPRAAPSTRSISRESGTQGTWRAASVNCRNTLGQADTKHASTMSEQSAQRPQQKGPGKPVRAGKETGKPHATGVQSRGSTRRTQSVQTKRNKQQAFKHPQPSGMDAPTPAPAPAPWWAYNLRHREDGFASALARYAERRRGRAESKGASTSDLAPLCSGDVAFQSRHKNKTLNI